MNLNESKEGKVKKRWNESRKSGEEEYEMEFSNFQYLLEYSKRDLKVTILLITTMLQLLTIMIKKK